MTTPEETLEDIKRTLDWHIEDYHLAFKDQTIKSVEDAYNLGWFEAMETLKKKYFGGMNNEF